MPLWLFPAQPILLNLRWNLSTTESARELKADLSVFTDWGNTLYSFFFFELPWHMTHTEYIIPLSAFDFFELLGFRSMPTAAVWGHFVPCFLFTFTDGQTPSSRPRVHTFTVWQHLLHDDFDYCRNLEIVDQKIIRQIHFLTSLNRVVRPLSIACWQSFPRLRHGSLSGIFRGGTRRA